MSKLKEVWTDGLFVHMLRSIRAMGRCRRVWMIFSLYYGVDLTRGFMSVALVLLDASVQVTPHTQLDVRAAFLTLCW